MTLIVTGAARFIGGHVCRALLDAGRQVVCIDSFDDFYNPAVKREPVRQLAALPAFTLVEADIRDLPGAPATPIEDGIPKFVDRFRSRR
jgi:UDP-glucuronate 4-epimerase